MYAVQQSSVVFHHISNFLPQEKLTVSLFFFPQIGFALQNAYFSVGTTPCIYIQICVFSRQIIFYNKPIDEANLYL